MTLYPELTVLESEILISNLSLPFIATRVQRRFKITEEGNGMSPTLFVA